jgi:hypothetical protein
MYAVSGYISGNTTPSILAMGAGGYEGEGSNHPVLDVTSGTSNGTGALGSTTPYDQSQPFPQAQPWNLAVGPLAGNPLAEDVVETQLGDDSTSMTMASPTRHLRR